jgi:hypothetical protein
MTQEVEQEISKFIYSWDATTFQSTPNYGNVFAESLK